MDLVLYITGCLLSTLVMVAGIPAQYSPSRFTSHVSVHTPAHSFSHGVGDVVNAPAPPLASRRFPGGQMHRNTRVLAYTSFGNRHGYPKLQPTVPFYQEEIPLSNSLLHPSWHSSSFLNYETLYMITGGGTIPVLPASPYRVNSANPESLWPEGLFIPPIVPARGFGVTNTHSILSKSDDFTHPAENAIDPYLLSDEEALQSLESIHRHGELFFHEIPHERSLAENQQMRIDNGLEPHRLGSIRHTWIYFRP